MSNVKKRSTDVIRSRVIRGEIDHDYYQFEASRHTGGPRFGFLKEAFENSLTAGATAFLIIVKGRGRNREMWFADNGRGMGTETGQQGFIDVGRSPYRNDPTERSQHGTGHQAYMHQANICEVIDIHGKCGPSEADTFRIDWEKHRRGFGSQGGPQVEIHTANRSSLNYQLPSGATTGVCIKLCGGWIGPSITGHNIVSEWGLEMPPRMADLVTVICEDGQHRKLETIEVAGEGEPLDWLEKKVPILGTVYTHLFFPRKVKRAHKLWVGSARNDQTRGNLLLTEQLCTWSDLLRNCPPSGWDDQLDILSRPEVRGWLCAEAFMPFRSNDSQSLMQDVYSSEVWEAWKRYLLLQVVPKLQAVLEQRQTTDAQRGKEEVVDEMRRYLGTGGGRVVVPPPVQGGKVVAIRPSSVEMAFGQELHLEVYRKPSDTRQLEWCVVSSGQGTLVPRIGERVKFKAPDVPGELVLKASDIDRPDVFGEVRVSVVPVLQPRIKPSVVTVAPGHSCELKAINVDDWCAADRNGQDILWMCDAADVGGGFEAVYRGRRKVADTARGSSVIYRAGDVVNEEGFTITMRIDSERCGKAEERTCIVRVKEPDIRPGGDDAGDLIVLEDKLYNINPSGTGLGGALVQVSTGASDRATATYDWDSPEFKAVAGNKQATMQVAISALIMEHVLAWHSGAPLDAEALLERVSEISRAKAVAFLAREEVK